MKREIKFRAWDDGKKEWLLGYNYPNLGGFSMDGECVLMGEWANVCTSFMFENNNRKRTDFKLMQFTGLKDKNGIEIYEGDILTYSGITSNGNKIIREVKYNVENARFQSGMYLLSQSIELSEIIGNIHENPELLC